MASSFRRQVYDLVEFVPHEDAPDRTVDWFDWSMIALIVANTISVCLESVPEIHARHSRTLYIFEVFSIAVFTIEYVLRLWSCTINPRYAHPLWGRLRMLISPMALIDLLAIAPFYYQLLSSGQADLRFMLSLRLFRMLRVMKIGRYSAALAMLGRVIRNRRDELAAMTLVLAVVLVVSGGLMYYAENDTQPEVFTSIPHSLWWAVVTLTTIGYGDAYPKTGIGKLLGGIIAVCGIGFVALPTAIVSAGFAEELGKRRQAKKPQVCPHCGKSLEEGCAADQAPASEAKEA